MMWHKEPIAYSTPPDVRFTLHKSETIEQISIATFVIINSKCGGTKKWLPGPRRC